VDYRRKRGEHAPIHIEGAVVEWVESFKFLGIHITKDKINMVNTHLHSLEEGLAWALAKLYREWCGHTST
jgi:hypothetical protein